MGVESTGEDRSIAKDLTVETFTNRLGYIMSNRSEYVNTVHVIQIVKPVFPGVPIQEIGHLFQTASAKWSTWRTATDAYTSAVQEQVPGVHLSTDVPDEPDHQTYFDFKYEGRHIVGAYWPKYAEKPYGVSDEDDPDPLFTSKMDFVGTLDEVVAKTVEWLRVKPEVLDGTSLASGGMA